SFVCRLSPFLVRFSSRPHTSGRPLVDPSLLSRTPTTDRDRLRQQPDVTALSIQPSHDNQSPKPCRSLDPDLAPAHPWGLVAPMAVPRQRKSLRSCHNVRFVCAPLVPV